MKAVSSLGYTFSRSTRRSHDNSQNEPLIICLVLNALQMVGPTIVGDEHSDAELMERLGAKLHKQMGNNL